MSTQIGIFPVISMRAKRGVSNIEGGSKRGSDTEDLSEEEDVDFETYQDGKKVRLSAEERHLLKSTFCELCGGLYPFDDNPILLCDGHRCNKAYHIKCLEPPLDKVPEGDFMGPCCEASKKASQKPVMKGVSGRGHIRRMRLLNRSHGAENVPTLDQHENPSTFLFSQFNKSFSNRRKSSLVESVEDFQLPGGLNEFRTPTSHSAAFSSVDGASVDSDDNGWHDALMSSHEKLVKDLQAIVGMDRIKDLLIDINCKINLRKERVRRSLSSNLNGSSTTPVGSGMAPHIAIIGNPGTGKSMIGRILAKMLHRSHAVKRNVFVKAHRSDLVAGYLGQTALKTAQLIEEARGGIMFIDEAHQLINPNKEDYGIEAYREIMKEMLSERAVDEDRVTFIFAGYPKQMNRFLSHDAGMESRISFRIHLPDYTLQDLAQICSYKLTNRSPSEGLPTKIEASTDLENVLRILPPDLVPRYNARISDLLLDKAEAALAKRMLVCPPADDSVDIFTLKETDFRNAAVSLRQEMLNASSNETPGTSESGSSPHMKR
jgi:stage V sporulation protein K